MDLKLPDRYELAASPLLGEGGMGRVVKARDTLMDLPVAIKVVRPDLASDPRFRKLFDLEVRISARFTHPHIVPIHDHGELEDGTPWLGLALADAGSFKSFFATDPEWDEILRVFLELLEALGHLHARDVVHRDVKPENVLLHTDDDGMEHVWLADLGLAKAGTQLARRKGKREGTPGYMAPEQSMGLPREFGPATDVYSVGVMLWEAVTGSLPFERHLTSANADLPTLSPKKGLLVPGDLSLVLRNCLDPEPLSRYDLTADLRHDLLALGEPTAGQSDFDGPEERLGTVAPAASSLAGATSEVLSALADADDSSPGFDPYVPQWNRPLPVDFPEFVRPEKGFGVSARASLQLFALRELPLVAREEYRQALWEEAKRVREEGQSRVVLVIGEAGSGKSHLVDGLARDLEQGGWAETVRLAYQDPRGAEDGYFGAARTLLRPWKESKASLIARLRRRLARERGVLNTMIKEEASLLARWCGFSAPDEEPVALGLGLREVFRHLQARSWRGLSLMVLEDAHYGLEDGDGLWLAESILRGEDLPRLLTVVTLRREELERNALLRVRVDKLVEDGAARIDLPMLDQQSTRDLIGECLALEPELAAQAAQRCEGNPLFARQLLVEWASRGWLVPNGSEFKLADGVDISEVLPTDASALLQARVQGLAEASQNHRRFRDTIHMAAMAGLAVPRDLVLALTGEDLAEFTLGCGLLREKEDRLFFQSNLLHQAVKEQGESRRDAAYLHRRLGRAWARYGDESGHDVSLDVGRHAMRGRDFEVAIDALLTCAQLAWKRRGSDDLTEASALAVEATYRSPKIADRTGWANLWKGRAHELKGEPDHARNHYQVALEHFIGVNEDHGAAEASIGVAKACLQMGLLDEADEWFGEALQQAKDLDDRLLQIQAIDGRAWLEQQRRNFDGAEILFVRAANWASKLEDHRSQGESLLGQAFVARRRGEFDEADEIYEEAIESFQESDAVLGVARCWIGMGVVRRQRCLFSEAEALFTRARAVAKELGAMEVVMAARYRQAEVARRTGDLDRALRLYNAHRHWAMLNKKREAEIFAEIGLAMVALKRENMAELYDRTNAVSRLLNEMPSHWLWATYRLLVAAMLAHRGDETQTYTWIWSASELGISDVVDEDIAYLLTDITAIAVRDDWRNVVRVAGRHAFDQLRRLGDPRGASFVKQQMDKVLLTR